jgi:tRNA A-37 threonylcarbamoyl transferase component Bud32
MTDRCLGESELLAYVAGDEIALSAEEVQVHLDRCAECRALAVEAIHSVRGNGPRDAGLLTLTEGEQLLNRYTIVRFVASGGMGEVYEARDELLGERVALKTLRCTALDSQAAFGRIRAEVQLARRVTHPNVCRILEFGVHERSGAEPIPFFTMEFLEGQTLARKLVSEGPLPPDDVLALATQLAAGLSAIHAAGIAHRDFKSENVFLLPPPEGAAGTLGRAVVMDFGLARPTTEDQHRSFSSAGMVVGTAAYMAPEQLLGKPATARSDVFALGIVLFEALTGRLPFVGRTSTEVAVRRVLEAAPSPSSARPGIAPLWDRVVARCLAREPEDRFPSAAAVAEALSGDPERSERPERPERPRGRRRWLVAAPLALAAGAAGFALLPRPAAPRLVEGWGQPEPIESFDTGFTFYPNAAMNAAGVAVVVWPQELKGANRLDLWANRFEPGSGWDRAKLIEGDEAHSVRDAVVSVDGAGRALVVWLLGRGPKTTVWTNRFEPGTGWVGAERLDEYAGTFERPRVVSEANGRAIATWDVTVAGRPVVRARRFEPGRGWLEVETISEGEEPAREPDAVIDGAGTAMVTFTQGPLAREIVKVRLFRPGVGWLAVKPLETESSNGTSLLPLMDMNRRGHVGVAWRRTGKVGRDIWAADFVPGRGWSPAQLLETQDAPANIARITVDDDGNMLATWAQETREGKRVFSSYKRTGAAWGKARPLPVPTLGNSEKPELRGAPDGHAIVTWYHIPKGKKDGDVWVDRFDPRTGWAGPRLVESRGGDARDPYPAIAPGGRGLVVWAQRFEGEHRLWAIRF